MSVVALSSVRQDLILLSDRRLMLLMMMKTDDQHNMSNVSIDQWHIQFGRQ